MFPRLALTRSGVLLAAVSLMAAWTATPALAQSPGLPGTWTSQRIDSPNPVGGGNFGWGVTSADVTGDGEPDLMVAQSQDNVPGEIFLFDGETGRHVDTIRPPERNPPGGGAEAMAFVYVEKMADLGSCPGGRTSEICPLGTIGAPDGRPEIIAGSRGLFVDDPTEAGDDLRAGRAYVFDGATRAVLKRIDMPPDDRRLQKSRGASPQFGRLVMSPQGLPACAGSAAEGNNLGTAPCPSVSDAVRLGDMDGGGRGDVLVGVRGFREIRSTAAPGSQCASTAPVEATSTAGTCTAGRAYMYRGEEIAGTSPQEILDGKGAGETVRTLKNPFGQTAGQEFGGNMFRVGDVGRCTGGADPATGKCGTSSFEPDGRPDIIVADRNVDYPLTSPSSELPDVGAGHLFDGATGGLIDTFRHPDPQPRAEFAGGFNSGPAPGDLGNTAAVDVYLGAPAQNVRSTGDGRGYVQTRGVSRGLHFATLDDPTPNLGENFGASSAGVGDLVPGSAAPANELLVAGYGPFNTASERVNQVIGDVHVFNPTNEKALATIPDPDRNGGSGFGMGLIPMGDLNDDGFLDLAVSAYLSDAPPGGQAAQGRAFIFRSAKAGRCANPKRGTNRDDRLRGTPVGDRIFGLRGDDALDGLDGADCLDGGSGDDRFSGSSGKDRIVGRSGDDRAGGGTGNDRMFGGSGRDRMGGGSGHDIVAGGSGNDFLTGGSGNNRLYGERGNDRLVSVGGRRDLVDCGPGRDTAHIGRGDRVRGCERVVRRR